jgi:hypothetical protein
MRTLQSVISNGIDKFLEENGFKASFPPNLLNSQTQADLSKYIAKEISIYLGRE